MIHRGLLLSALLAIVLPAAVRSQDLADVLEQRADQVPDEKRAFQETWLLPRAGEVAQGPGDTEFAGRVTVRQEEGRERIEVRRMEGGALADPLVVVGDGDAYWLVTPVGATPFAESEPSKEAFVRLVLAGPAGEAPAHRTVQANGGIAAVVLRHALADDFDADDAFAVRPAALGGGRLSETISSFSPAGDTEVVAAAGARGVDRVETANGEVDVTPDPGAVEWMESQAVPALEVETFKRESGLAPYDALPEAGEAPAPGGAR